MEPQQPIKNTTAFEMLRWREILPEVKNDFVRDILHTWSCIGGIRNVVFHVIMPEQEYWYTEE